jgi:N-acetyl-gamma-glutamyl-phosphate reductase
MTAGIIGASGFAGAEIVRLLAMHPEKPALVLGSQSLEGKSISQVYPNFLDTKAALKGSELFISPQALIEKSDVVFAALPAGAGDDYAVACMERGIPYIDMSADFRFGKDEDTYREWYGKGYKRPELREHSVYGLPELNRSQIKALAQSGKCIIGNPGCYPTAASLAAYPVLARGLAAQGASIIVDAASGVTGRGKDPNEGSHFCAIHDSMAPYKVGNHRHTPEIEANMRAMAGGKNPLRVIFTPHLAPMNRGILATVYIPLAKKAEIADLEALYQDFYKNEKFLRVLPRGSFANTGKVRLSNYCDVSIALDKSATMLIACGAIDNMVKGAAGQALQNMNIVMGYEEDAGLNFIPASF